MKSRQELEFISFQLIVVTVNFPDQYFSVHCDPVFEKHNFCRERSNVGFCIIRRKFHGLRILNLFEW